MRIDWLKVIVAGMVLFAIGLLFFKNQMCSALFPFGMQVASIIGC